MEVIAGLDKSDLGGVVGIAAEWELAKEGKKGRKWQQRLQTQ